MLNIKKAWSLFNLKQKKNFFIIIFVFFFISILEVLSIATIIPFVTAIFSPETLSSINFLVPFLDFMKKNDEIILYIFCASFFSIFFIKNMFFVWMVKLIHQYVYNFKAEISKRLLTKYFRQNYQYFLNNPQGKLTNYLLFEANVISERYLLSLLIILSEMMIVISLLLLLLINKEFEILWIIIPILFLAIYILKFINRRIKKWGHERVNIGSQNSDLIQRIFLGIRDIFFSNSGNYIIQKFYNLALKQAKIDTGNAFVTNIPKALLELAAIASLLFLIIYLKLQNFSDTEILTNLTFYFAISYRVIPSFNKILINYQRIKYSTNSVDHFSEILALPDQRIISLSESDKVDFRKIKIENFNFSYDEGQNVLSNINFEIKKGEIVGIFGDSGSGKSTLLNLICLLLKSKNGNYYFNDEIIKNEFEIKKIQEIITFVSQDTFLIDDSIKNNIIFHNKDEFNLEKFNHAIKFSYLDDLINSIQNGADYNVGSNSRKISSGQKQRIALARAIYNLRQILILDEATNALDEKTEKDIINNIQKLKVQTSIIIVSHNKNNLAICDKIYRVKNNKLEFVENKNSVMLV